MAKTTGLASLAELGHKHSIDTKKKISEANVRRFALKITDVSVMKGI